MHRTLLAGAALAALLAGGCSAPGDRAGVSGSSESSGALAGGSAGMASGSSAGSSAGMAEEDRARSSVRRSGGGVAVESAPLSRRGTYPGTVSGPRRGATGGEPGGT